MLRDSLDYKLAFARIRSLNIGTARKLLAKIGDEQAFFTLPTQHLRTLTRLNVRVLDDAYRQHLLRDAVTERAFIDSTGVRPRYFADDATAYPRRLAECDDAPVMLYTLGETDLDAAHFVAIVGTRHATVYGTGFTERFVEQLAQTVDGNVVIVSGLAYGIDVAAHRAALKCGLPTVGVVAEPLNTIYPAEHRDVASRMIHNNGALVTEYATTDAVHRGNFLARNRIIAGLCDATVVVESDRRGGAMVTARIARDYDREVFAVPGRVTDRYSTGCLHLLATNTADLLTDAQGFIDAMRWPQKEAPGTQKQMALELPAEQEQLLQCIVDHPDYTVNDIASALGRPYSQLSDLLFQLEMADLIVAIPGGRYAAVGQH